MDRYTSVITKSPNKDTTAGMTDGPIAGNGDVSVVLLGEPDFLKIVIAKSDVWNAVDKALNGTGLSTAATLDFMIPALYVSDYYVEQRMEQGELYGRFTDGATVFEVRCVVCACENTILLEMKFSGPQLTHSVFLNVPENGSATWQKKGRGDGFDYAERHWEGDDKLFPTHVMTTMKAMPMRKENGARIYTYVIGVMTNHDSAAYRSMSEKRARTYSQSDLDYALFCHRDWWKRFWDKSDVHIGDETLERFWHGGHYLMACCSRNEKFPPGLYGNFGVSDSMPWRSDYHLNYNYQAPYYALPASNHVELMDCYDAPLMDFMAQGEMFASDFLGCRGIYYPVGLGPLGLNTSTKPALNEHYQGFLGQKSNAGYAAVVMVLRWRATLDVEYAKRTAYPFLRKLADFWEDYLVFEDGRYVIYNDSTHEVPYFIGNSYKPERHDDFNPILELAFVRMIMKALLDISARIGFDEERREKWQHILDHISDYPTMEQNGKTTFRLTERGSDLCDTNTVHLQHIYPTGALGRESGERWMEIAVNSFWDGERWDDSNGFCSYFPCAARLGIDPELILSKLREIIGQHAYGSTAFDFGGGGIENCSTIPATINEMLLQSYEGVVRLFPDWTRTKDASFKSLRADGAFLITASIKNGEINAEIYSEKGETLVLENPYSDRSCTVETKNGSQTIPASGRITLKTTTGETVYMK